MLQARTGASALLALLTNVRTLHRLCFACCACYAWQDLKELVLHRLGQAEGEASSRSEEHGVILLGFDEETRAVAQRLRESRGLRVRLVCSSRCMVH